MPRYYEILNVLKSSLRHEIGDRRMFYLYKTKIGDYSHVIPIMRN